MELTGALHSVITLSKISLGFTHDLLKSFIITKREMDV